MLLKQQEIKHAVWFHKILKIARYYIDQYLGMETQERWTKKGKKKTHIAVFGAFLDFDFDILHA